MNCLKCSNDVSDLMDWDTLCQDFIICPCCGNKMTVEYDETFDEENGEDSYWWLEQYYENQ